jgi:hypothetical protein
MRLRVEAQARRRKATRKAVPMMDARQRNLLRAVSKAVELSLLNSSSADMMGSLNSRTLTIPVLETSLTQSVDES